MKQFLKEIFFVEQIICNPKLSFVYIIVCKLGISPTISFSVLYCMLLLSQTGKQKLRPLTLEVVEIENNENIY